MMAALFNFGLLKPCCCDWLRLSHLLDRQVPVRIHTCLYTELSCSEPSKDMIIFVWKLFWAKFSFI